VEEHLSTASERLDVRDVIGEQADDAVFARRFLPPM